MLRKIFTVSLFAILFAFSGNIGTAAGQKQDIVILYTNDVHCAVDENIGYAGLASYKEKLLAENKSVILVDAGDAVQGESIGMLTKGRTVVKLMNAVGYDIAVPGNHEFDYGLKNLLALRKMANFTYLAANFIDINKKMPVLPAYKILEREGVKIAFIGAITPNTLTSSTPAYFKNADGKFIYSFSQDKTGSLLYEIIQQSVDQARQQGADYVILVGHLGIEEGASPWMSTEVIQNTTGIDAVIDAHSHSTIIAEKVKNKTGQSVLLTQTGSKLHAIGELRIGDNGVFSSRLIADYPDKALNIKNLIDKERVSINKTLNNVVAKSDFRLVDSLPDNPQIRIIRNVETNLGDLCADALREVFKTDVSFTNSGSIRTTLPSGDITYGDIISVYPFNNKVSIIKASGQDILDALEFGAMLLPNSSGKFLQVAGLQYEIHMYLPSTVVVDENKLFKTVAGEYRVKNVLVNGAPLQLDKFYTVASTDYLLSSQGDGFTMFNKYKTIRETGFSDNQILLEFVTKNLAGKIPTKYQDYYGMDRIVEKTSLNK